MSGEEDADGSPAFSLERGGQFKVCVAQSVQYGYLGVYRESTLKFSSDMVRVSEYETVQFKPLRKEDVILGAVDAFDMEIKKVHAEAGKKIRDLEERKQKFLSLTHQTD